MDGGKTSKERFNGRAIADFNEGFSNAHDFPETAEEEDFDRNT